jgi:hypothetical protein
MTEFTDISEEEMLRELEAMGFTDSTTADPTTTPISEGEVKDNTDTNMWAYGPDGEKMRMNGESFSHILIPRKDPTNKHPAIIVSSKVQPGQERPWPLF